MDLLLSAGANGVGKTTFARAFLQEYDYEFLNADAHCQKSFGGKSGGKDEERANFFFQRLNKTVENRKSLLIESTLAGRYPEKFLKSLKDENYRIIIIFLFADSPEILIERIAERVKKGGHFVPDEDVRRRFIRGKQNFWSVYKNLTDQWFLYYNMEDNFQLIATGEKDRTLVIDENLFEKFRDENKTKI